ncbi:MAG: hypothetical protein IPL77_10785 [Flavobacteriales bacterium]|nr:hypothetical protein [Flavobacteriales bacterium]
MNGSAGQVGPLDDEVDWRVDANGTVTAYTGPTFDHTSGTPQGRYLYLESSGSCIGEQGVFLTPCLNLPSGGAFALSFWYHMFRQRHGRTPSGRGFERKLDHRCGASSHRRSGRSGGGGIGWISQRSQAPR